MMKTTLRLAAILIITALFGCNQAGDKSAAQTELKTSQDKFSYSAGMEIGKMIKQQVDAINFDALTLGIKDGYAGAKPRVTEEEMNAAMAEIKKEVEAKQAAAGQKNKKDSDEFMAKNKTRKEVKSTASGLQYEVLTEGKGKRPKSEDLVKLHYKGKLINGTVFDSSYERNEPAMLVLSQVIPGFSEAVQMMKEGSKYKVYIPSELAYGERAPKEIGPNSALVFELELLSIEKMPDFTEMKKGQGHK